LGWYFSIQSFGEVSTIKRLLKSNIAAAQDARLMLKVQIMMVKPVFH